MERSSAKMTLRVMMRNGKLFNLEMTASTEHSSSPFVQPGSIVGLRARLAGKDQVAFFPGPIEAEQSGFRPCHRCQPREAGPSPKAKLVDQVCRYIEANVQ